MGGNNLYMSESEWRVLRRLYIYMYQFVQNLATFSYVVSLVNTALAGYSE